MLHFDAHTTELSLLSRSWCGLSSSFYNEWSAPDYEYVSGRFDAQLCFYLKGAQGRGTRAISHLSIKPTNPFLSSAESYH